MALSDLNALIDRLRNPGLRNRVGLLTLPEADLGSEPDIAARQNIGHIDLRHELLQQVPANASFVPLGSQQLGELINRLSQRTDQGDCVLLHALDLLLARLSPSERTAFWEYALQGLGYRPCALILTLPFSASSLLPTSSLYHLWVKSERFVSL